jgi:3-oxoacyl-[acyl-carrier-protein] synthase II
MTVRVPVAITGLGLVSPLGHSVGQLSRRVAAGERAATAADGGVYVDALPLDVVPADKRARLGRLDRLCRLFLTASYLAVDDACIDLGSADPERVGLSFGTGLGCLLSNAEFYDKVVEHGAAAASPRVFAYTVSSAAAGEVSIALGIHGPNVTSHAGAAAGVAALGYGADLIRSGKADIVLAGGADANGAALIEALRAMRLLKRAETSRPFRDAVAGVWPSEGAVVAVLERGDLAQARRARIRAWLEGYACGFEPSLSSRAPVPDGVAATVHRALAAGGRAPGDIAWVMASAHGTPIDACERDALRAAAGERIALAPKAALGEAFAASGMFAIALTAGLFEEGQLTAGVALRLDGTPLPAGPLTAGPVLINDLCYSGTAAAMVIAPAGT